MLWDWGEVVRSSKWAGLLSLHLHRLMAAQVSTGSAGSGHQWIQLVLILVDPEPDASEGRLSSGPRVGGGWLSLARSLLRDTHHTFTVSRRLHIHCLVVNQPTIGSGAIRLFAPLDQEAGASQHTTSCRCVDLVSAPLSAEAKDGKSQTFHF